MIHENDVNKDSSENNKHGQVSVFFVARHRNVTERCSTSTPFISAKMLRMNVCSGDRSM